MHNPDHNMSHHDSDNEHYPVTLSNETRPDSPPQLNPTCRGHGGGGDGRQDIGGEADAESTAFQVDENEDNDSGSDDGSASFECPEGIEDHHIRMGGHWMTWRSVWLHIARHEQCTCHRDNLAEDRSPLESPPSGLVSPSSMLVNISSSEQSMASSFYMHSHHASSAALFAHTGAIFEEFPFRLAAGGCYITNPIWLTPDQAAYPYPTDLSMRDSDRSNEGM